MRKYIGPALLLVAAWLAFQNWTEDRTWLRGLLVVLCVVSAVQMYRRDPTAAETEGARWKKAIVPGLGLAAVFSSDRWFPPLYRALPTWLWMMIVVVAGCFGAWRWIAFFTEPKHKDGRG